MTGTNVVRHVSKIWPNGLLTSAYIQNLVQRPIIILHICKIRPNDAPDAFKTVPGDLQDRSRMDSLRRFIFKGMHDENDGRASKAEHPRSPHEPPTMFPRRIQGAPKKPSQNALIETTFLFVLGDPKKHIRRPQNASTANLHICRKEPA